MRRVVFGGGRGWGSQLAGSRTALSPPSPSSPTLTWRKGGTVHLEGGPAPPQWLSRPDPSCRPTHSEQRSGTGPIRSDGVARPPGAPRGRGGGRRGMHHGWIAARPFFGGPRPRGGHSGGKGSGPVVLVDTPPRSQPFPETFPQTQSRLNQRYYPTQRKARCQPSAATKESDFRIKSEFSTVAPLPPLPLARSPQKFMPQGGK